MEEIKPVFSPAEIEEAMRGLMELRIDCFIKMYDGGKYDNIKQPQYYSIKQKLTIEFIEQSDEWLIGREVKNALQKLKDHVHNQRK